MLHAHDSWTSYVSFTSDSRYVITGGADGTAGLWDVRDPAAGGTVLNAGRNTHWVLIGTTPHGDLLTIPDSGPPLRWDVDAASLARRACDIVRRDLTPEEWALVLPDRPYEHTCTR